MPTKRTPLHRKQCQRITPAAVEAYRNGDDAELRRLLGLKPWEESPLEAHPDDAPSARSLWWPQAIALREELVQAVAA